MSDSLDSQTPLQPIRVASEAEIPSITAAMVDPAQPAADASARPEAGQGVSSAASNRGLRRLTWFLLTLLAAQYLVPYLLERYQFAITRGRQRAEYETATEAMGGLPLSTLSKSCRLVSHRVAPSVVHIDVGPIRRVATGVEDPSDRHGRGLVTPGQGSGVIIDPEGFIVTNHHVVADASDIQVALSDGRVYSAQIIGVDPPSDLAVLKIEATDLVAADWGDSGDMEVGELVWAVGSPFGLQRTVTFGILSGKHRSGMTNGTYQDYLQTDAAVNPGNSGGPLVDAEGRIVGINTAILGDVYQGISFAIPSRLAQDVCARLRRDGQVARGWLGVRLRDISLADVRQLGLDGPDGAMIAEVIRLPGTPSPAHDVGLRARDVVLSWNGEPIQRTADLMHQVAMTEIGSQAAIEVAREGERLQFQLTVAERPVD
jgi:serine protease Do